MLKCKVGHVVIFCIFYINSLSYPSGYNTDYVNSTIYTCVCFLENMRLFRAQRNFYISGFALFLSLVIRRLIILISTQATLLAQNEAAMRQAQSATTTARSLLSERSIGAQNDSNEAHDKAVSELKNQIKELQVKNQDLENNLTKEKKDKEAVKSQAESLAKEYDRLTKEHSKLVQSSGDKKTD